MAKVLNGRMQNAARNSFWGIISKIISLILGFASRTIFIHYLGTVYLGVNGVYTEVLKVLSFVELGFGTALIFTMYKPVAENDDEKTIKLLHFYRDVYRIIALLILCLGLLLLPFLQYILKGADNLTLKELRIYFLIFLANTIINYFVSYKFSYVNAIQQNYIVTNIDTIINVVVIVLQAVIIIITKNFLAYLLVHTISLLISRIFISVYLNKKFEILRRVKEYSLTKEEKTPIYKEVRGLVTHKFAEVAIHSTDNIIISSFTGLGVVAVGLISNYNLIITNVTAFVTIFFSSLVSGLGNLAATESVDKYRDTFNELNFISFWIYGFCAIAFYVLIPPFITLWLGEEFLIDELSFLLIVINCYLVGMSSTYNHARAVKGNFNKDMWVSCGHAVINLIVSIICAKFLGLVGVYVGTIASRVFFIIFRPYTTHKFLFDESSGVYYGKMLFYFIIVIFLGALIKFIVNFIINKLTILTFLLSACVVFCLVNGMFLILFFKTGVFVKIKSRMLSFLIRRKS